MMALIDLTVPLDLKFPPTKNLRAWRMSVSQQFAAGFDAVGHTEAPTYHFERMSIDGLDVRRRGARIRRKCGLERERMDGES
jgi:hypothetical protein